MPGYLIKDTTKEERKQIVLDVERIVLLQKILRFLDYIIKGSYKAGGISIYIILTAITSYYKKDEEGMLE